LLWVDDAPLIVRTCKQLLERDIPAVVVTPHEPIVRCLEANLPNEMAAGRVSVLDVGQPKLFAETALASASSWPVNDVIIGLMGDCYFSLAAMDTIQGFATRPPVGTAWFGRDRPSRVTGNEAGGEIFGWLHVDPDDTEHILHGLRVAIDDANSKPAERDMIGTPLGSPWQFRRATLGLPLMRDPGGEAWVEINDFTDDFDTPENYKKWLDAYRRRIIRQPRFTCLKKQPSPPSS
jgi:hypothetical protein